MNKIKQLKQIKEYLKALIEECGGFIPQRCPNCGNVASIEHEEWWDGEEETHKWKCLTENCRYPRGARTFLDSIHMLLDEINEELEMAENRKAKLSISTAE